MSGSNGKATMQKELAVRTELVRLKSEQEHIKESGRERDELLRHIIATQKMLAEKVIMFETHQEHQNSQLEELKKDTKIQNKILWTILTAVVGAAIKMVFKF